MQRHAVRFSVATELEPVEGNWYCRRAGKEQYGEVGTAAEGREGGGGTEPAAGTATATGNGSAQPGGTRRTSGKMERQTHGRTDSGMDADTGRRTAYTVSIARGLAGAHWALGLHVKHIHHECQSDRWQMRLQLVCSPISPPHLPPSRALP